MTFNKNEAQVRRFYENDTPGAYGRDPQGDGLRRAPAKDYQIALQANVPYPYPVPRSRSFTLVSASGGTPVKVRFNGGSQQQTMSPGDGQDEIDFDDVEFESASAQVIKFRVGDGYQRTGQTVNVNTTATVANSNSNPALADVLIPANTKVQIAPANANRKSLLVRSIPENTAAIRLGNNATVTATAGLRIDPDETVSLPTEGAVYAHNTSLTDAQTVTLIELERV